VRNNFIDVVGPKCHILIASINYFV
jgi:hypothetical protein